MSMEYLKDMPIAILGAGGVGKTLAGDSALGGARVRLWDQPEFAKKTLAHIMDYGIRVEGPQMNMFGYRRDGFGKLEMASDNMAEIVKGAGIIIIGVVAMAHEKIFKELIPLLEDGQVVAIIPDNYGTFIFRKMMMEMGCEKDVIVGSWETSPYGARVKNEGGLVTNIVDIRNRCITLRGAALPQTDTDKFLETAKYIPGFETINKNNGVVKADTVLDNCLSNGNPVIHVPGCVLGVAMMQNWETIVGRKIGEYSLYAHALCPGIASVQVEFRKEMEAIAEAAGVGIVPCEHDGFFSRSTDYGPAYMGPGYAVPFEENIPYKYGDGPTSLENRYMTEDIPIGCYMYQQFARRYGIETPAIDSMVYLGNVMLGRDLIAENGRTLDDIGIGHMTDEEIQKWIREGIYTPKN